MRERAAFLKSSGGTPGRRNISLSSVFASGRKAHEGARLMPNRLAETSSLYLRQHAENPVDWYPWGDEAFARARAEDKPLLVSIGYSSCHWCHVMAHESFEDDYIASLMNKHFVCVKVDREEHPDVDAIYMESVQMMHGHGGWPLNVFCLPDGRPFAGGTYFPPDDRRGGMIPWPQLLVRVADFYKRQRDDLEENAKAILGNLAAGNHPFQASGDPLPNEALPAAAKQITEAHDDEFGGFGDAPKFPPASALDFLMSVRGTAAVELRQPALRDRIDGVINTTLTAMAHGGLFDQVGGGFARYCVDRHWIIPHFEKMLYDNGLLLSTYARAHTRYPKPLYKAVVEETVTWLEREMRTPHGTFMAAVDADSEDGEGFFYTWTPAEIDAVLGPEEGAAFRTAYAVTEEGNFEHGRSQPVLVEADFEKRQALASARARLLEARGQRARPATDTKVIAAWNALVIRGLAHGAAVFDRPEWFATAARAARWILNHMLRPDGSLARVAYDDTVSGHATLEDYALLAEATLALASVAEAFEPGTAADWRAHAARLADAAAERFRDPKAMGFFSSGADRADLVHRKKDWLDNATPSGNSALVHVFSALYALSGEARHAAERDRLRPAYTGLAERAPSAVGHALAGFTLDATGLAVLKGGRGTDWPAALKALRAKPWRPVFLQPADDLPSGTFQLCVGTQCLAPTKNLAEVMEQL